MRAGKILFGAVVVPPMLLVEAWRSKDTRYQHWLLTAFFVIYGATIGIAFDPQGVGPDGVRHLGSVYTHYVGMGFPQFLQELGALVTFRPSPAPQEDAFIHLISYLSGGVFGVPELFFPFVAFVYGYVFTGSMLIIFRGFKRTRLPYVVLFLIFAFFLVKNIEGVNTVRTWTGLWVLVYGTLRFYQTRRPRYLLLMAMPPFVHFGYVLMAIPAYAILVFGSRPVLYTLLFVASNATTLIAPAYVQSLAQRNEITQQAFDTYYRDDVADAAPTVRASLAEGTQIWFALEKAGVQKWALNTLLATLLVTGVYPWAMSATQKRLFSIGLLALTLSNAVWFISAASSRSWIIGIVFIGAAFIMMRLSHGNQPRVPRFRRIYPLGLLASAILFIPYVAYNLSTILDYPSVFLLGAPFVVWIDPSLNVTMKEALQFLIYSVL